MDLKLFLCLLPLVIVVSVLELLKCILVSKKRQSAISWRDWIIETISMFFALFVLFVFLELKVIDNKWVSMVIGFVAYLACEYVLKKVLHN